MIKIEDYKTAMNILENMIKKTDIEKQKAVEAEDYSRANNQDHYSSGLRQALVLFKLIDKE
jgi:hypothetical protein